MLSRSITEIVMIGAGSLASHLGSALVSSGLKVVQVVNRTPAKGNRLAKRLGAVFTNDYKEICQNADLYIIAITDQAFPEVAGLLCLPGKLVVHTSGSLGMDSLKSISSETGVFYPLQTFPKHGKLNFRKIPLCLEASSQANFHHLAELAGRISDTVINLGSNDRKLLHLTAVFASNFTNFMFSVSQDLLKRHNIDFNLLRPLIAQTVKNVRKEDAFKLQTGPAVREDTTIMQEHLRLLSDNPDYRDIYKVISDSIIKYKKRNG